MGLSRRNDLKTEGHAMPAEQLFIGLCVTCNNSTDCVYRKQRGTDAIYCETFDAHVPSGGNGNKRFAYVSEVTPDFAASDGLKGLCVNCAHRDDCKLPRLGGGVWHCEEYE